MAKSFNQHHFSSGCISNTFSIAGFKPSIFLVCPNEQSPVRPTDYQRIDTFHYTGKCTDSRTQSGCLPSPFILAGKFPQLYHRLLRWHVWQLLTDITNHLWHFFFSHSPEVASASFSLQCLRQPLAVNWGWYLRETLYTTSRFEDCRVNM